MRALIVLAACSFALSACGDKAATEADANVAATLASEAIFANDTTVIDAATGDASNMAADVAYDENSLTAEGDVSSDGRTTRSAARPQQPRRSAERATSNAAEPAPPMETATETNGI